MGKSTFSDEALYLSVFATYWRRDGGQVWAHLPWEICWVPAKAG